MIIEGRDGDLIYSTTKLTPDDIKQSPVLKHPHICLLRQWLKDCESTNNPYVLWLYKLKGGTGGWNRCYSDTPMFLPQWEYKRSSNLGIVNGDVIPLGLSSHEEYNECVDRNMKMFTPIFNVDKIDVREWSVGNTWVLQSIDHLIEHRLIYTNRDEALKRVEAMVTWSEIK